MLLLTIVIVKGVEELIANFDQGTERPGGYLSCIIALVYWFTVYRLERIGSTSFLKPWARKMLSDFAYPVRLFPI